MAQEKLKAARKIYRVSSPPEGLTYVPDFLTEAEQAELLTTVENIRYYDFVMNGVAAKRKIHHYGFGYEFYSTIVHEVEPFPDWLAQIRDRAAPLVGIPAEQLEQALVAQYFPGAGIGWHRDAPAFGPSVVGISLVSDDVMRFRRTLKESFEIYKQPLQARSLYVLSGPARSVWQHSLAPVKQLRYSITFRTVRDKFKPSA
jgi:alkylated DNA repair dioxygenase AlkB